MNAWLGMALVLATLSGLAFGARFLQSSGRIGDEMARKAVHMGMGAVCLPFPWLFTEAWPVWALAIAACLALLAVRLHKGTRHGVGTVLHAVNRTSFGELYFPLAVAAVYTLGQRDPLLFVIPIATLTFADASGALIGKRWGRRMYCTLEGEKSVEGSLAVWAVASLCAFLPLELAGIDLRASATLAAAIGLFAMLVEAISWRGLDNALLPLAVLAQLGVFLHLTPAALSVRLGALLALTCAALVWRRGHLVDDSARIGAALALYFFWAIGGWRWLAAPIALVVSYARLMPVHPHEMPRHNLVAIICVSSSGILWAVGEALAPGRPVWLWLFSLGIAAQQAIIAIVRASQGWPDRSPAAWWLFGVSQAAAVQGVVLWLIGSPAGVGFGCIGAGVVCIAVGAGLFMLCEPKLRLPDDLNLRWWKQGIIALLTSLAGLSVSKI